MSIDPITFARFLVLPGATELLDAFSQIPPGPLRESVIHHAQVIAQSYAAAPPDYRAPDPLAAALVTPAPAKPPLALPSARIKFDGKDDQVVALARQGRKVSEIANETDVPLSSVHMILREARKAGIELPIKASGHNENVFHVSIDTLGPKAASAMTAAANTRGITLYSYLARRQQTVEMAQAGHGKAAIAKATSEPITVIGQWLTLARGAGLHIPYEPIGHAEPEPAPKPRPKLTVVPPQPPAQAPAVGDLFGDGSRGALVAQQKAAAKRGMTLDAYRDLRRSIVRQRLEGVPGSEIEKRTGMTAHFVKDAISDAGKAGIIFPPLDLKTYPKSRAGRPGKHKPRAKPGTGRPRPPWNTFWTDLAELNPAKITTITRAAERMGLTIEGLARKRQDALALFREGHKASSVVVMLGLPDLKMGMNWYGQAKRAGLLEADKATA